jgi:hypothetical protein
MLINAFENASTGGAHLAGDLLLSKANRLLNGDFTKRIHRHFYVGNINGCKDTGHN